MNISKLCIGMFSRLTSRAIVIAEVAVCSLEAVTIMCVIFIV